MNEGPIKLAQIMIWGPQRIEGQYKYGTPTIDDQRISLKRAPDDI